MPNWKEVLHEIQDEHSKLSNGNAIDTIRKKYLARISEVTGRNTIAYYSGWLQKPNAPDVIVNDKDKSGLMLAIHKLDRTKGLDIILHTPGGDVAATESLVDYLSSMFGNNIRAIVPQLSMSAGTMIALSCKQIIMGKHSNLGPIDPQMGGLACQAVIDEFQQAISQVQSTPHSAILWQTIISKYPPTFLGACSHAISWSKDMVSEWLRKNMCEGDESKISAIIDTFANHNKQKSHARHIPVRECQAVGLNILELENEPELQDAVLTTHHAFMHTFSNTYSVKIIENQMGVAHIEQAIMSPK